MIVVVAEKPSVARDIARVLGCGGRGEGCFRGEKYTVTWAIGHLVTLCEPGEIDARYLKWRMEDLPLLPETLPTKVIAKTKAQYGIVRKLICDPAAERLVCATDAGREGELIFRLIYQKSGCGKPVDRLWISSMTDAAIREGFSSLRPDSEYEGLYRSAVCRSQADWLVGMNASRAFSIRHGALLSVGRVQTPTLAILVGREGAIRAFTPEEYCTVTAGFGDYRGIWFDPGNADDRTNVRLPDRERASAIAGAVRRKDARVTKAAREARREAPPLLYDLTTLQRDANRLFGFTAAKTLRTAQELYESRKCITYPRTDSRFLPRDMQQRVSKTLASLEGDYRPLVEGIPGTGGRPPFSGRVFNDAKVTDHHAIIPTLQKADLAKMTQDQRALYDLVARRLIAAFYPAYEYESLRVVTEAAGHSFRSTGRTVLRPGWKALYPQAEAAGEEALPALAVGDERSVVSAEVKKEATKPPPPHTDASLLSAMEHAGGDAEDEELRDMMKGSGLGTPATRAAVIERLIKVGYAARRGKAIRATEKGERLIGVVPEEIASPEMTGRWELALEKIARMQADPERFMEGIRRFSAFLVDFAAKGEAKAGFFADGREKTAPAGAARRKSRRMEGLACPLCGEPALENSKAFGCSAWRGGCGFTLWKDALAKAGGPPLTEDIVRGLLKDGRAELGGGVLMLEGETLSFTPGGAIEPSLRAGIRREKPAAARRESRKKAQTGGKGG